MKNFRHLIFTGIFVIAINVSAQDFKVSINKLTEETQQLSEAPDNLKLVWWIPIEFWETVLQENKTMTDDQVNEILQVFQQYTLLATLNGTINDFGDITYVTREKNFKTLEIVDTHNKSFFPLKEDTIDKKTLDVILFMKPVLANMLGKVGENMHFFLFQKKDNPLERIINPKKEGRFSVKFDGEEFHWQLPLPSLVKPKKCPVDNKLMNGTWKYCPHHGKELVLQ